MSVAYPTTNYGVFNTNDWAVGSQVTNTGTLNCQILNAKQAVNTASLISSGGVSAVNVVASGSITGATVATTGAISAASVTATGAVSGATLTASGAVSGATLSSSGALTAGSISSSGAISGAGGKFSSLTVANGTTNTMTTDIAGNISSNSLTTAVGVTASGAGSFNGLSVNSGTTTNASISTAGAISGSSMSVSGAMSGVSLSVGSGNATISSAGNISSVGNVGAVNITGTGAVSGATLVATTSATIASSTINGTRASYLANANAGVAQANTCVVSDGSNNVGSLNQLTCAILNTPTQAGNSTLSRPILLPFYISGQAITITASVTNGWPGYYTPNSLNGQGYFAPLSFYAPCAGTYRVIVTLLSGPAQGTAQFLFNGTPYTYDCYTASYGLITQTFDTPLNAGINNFNLFPAGKNTNSTGYYIGFPFQDCLKLFRIS